MAVLPGVSDLRIIFRIKSVFLFLAALVFICSPAVLHASEAVPVPIPPEFGGGWQWGGGGTALYETPLEACARQHQYWVPNATFLGARRDTATSYRCQWTGTPINPGWVKFRCKSGFEYRAPGQCIKGGGTLWTEQRCGTLERGKSSPGSPSTAHPVSIATGTKTWAEQDYASEDGLLTVNRKYRSRMRGGEHFSFKEPDRFGAHWQGVIPGPLKFASTADSEVEYLPECGGMYAFESTDDPADVVFNANSAKSSEHRLKLDIEAPIPGGMGRKDFIETAPVSASGTGEFRLELPNGDYTLYRRPTVDANAVGVRQAVAVKHVKASGYEQYFDYEGDSPVPYRLRDSFGRQIDFEWAVTHDIPSRVGVSDRAIKKLTLPDGGYLEYDYDDGNAGKNFLGTASTTGGLGGPGSGSTITWDISNKAFAQNRLRTVKRKDAAGATLWSRNYLYENTLYRFALTGVEDHLGRRLTTYTYDEFGDVASTQSAEGADRHEFTRSDPSSTQMLRTVTGPLGHATTYEFEKPADRKSYSTAKLLSVKGSANGTVPADEMTYSYSGNLIASVNDRRGTTTSYTNDAGFRRPTLVKSAFGDSAEQQVQITWHPKWDLPVVQEEDGLRIDSTYDVQGRLISSTATDTTTHSQPYTTAGQSRTTVYSWTAQGRLAQINGSLAINAQGQDDITTFAHDASGNLTSVTNALGHVTQFAGHDANGRAASMTDANGLVTNFSYDALGRLISLNNAHPTNSALDAVTSFEYDGEGRVVGITYPQTAKLIVDYDSIGRATALRSVDGERIDFAYDAMGNVVSRKVKRSDGAVTQSIKSSFDALGRLLTETIGAGRRQSFQYDKEGNVTAITDPRDFTSSMVFDALGRLVTTTNPDGGVETASYDNRDRQLSYKDAIDVTTTFTRNGFGEVIQEISPDRGTSTYYYDAAGRMTAAIDGRGQRIDYTRDILGRLTAKVPVGRPASEAITYSYDSGGLGSYQLGRLTKVTDGSGETQFGYDHRGNLTMRQQVLGSSAAAVLAYGYDLADRISEITYPSGRAVRYMRDAKGRVNSITTRASPAAAWTTLATGMTYQPFGAVEDLTLGNSLIVENDRGLDGRLKVRRLTQTGIGGTTLSDLSYVHDSDGNVTSIDDAVLPERSAIYGYDSMGRLNLTVANGSGGSQDYSYNTGTNQLAQLVTPAGTRSFQYDTRGNLTAEARPAAATVSATYDGYGRLIGYDSSAEPSLTHVYNGMDDRVATTSSSVSGNETRRFVYAPDGRVLGEYGGSTNAVYAEFIWMSPEVGDTGLFGGDDGLGGYMPLSVVADDGNGAAQLSWVHGNHMGVPAVYTDASGSEIAMPAGYSAPGFPGQSRTFADLYYNRYRDYDPTTGRYIQADPIGLAGGPSPYSYAMNNPLRYTDPTGEFVPALVYGCAANPYCAAAVVGAVGYATYKYYNDNPFNPVGNSCPSALNYDIGDGGRSGGGGISIPGAGARGNDGDDACEIQKEDDELECNQWHIVGKRRREGYSSWEGYRVCMSTVTTRYGECRAGGMNPARIRTPLFLPGRRR